jgi:hypothetical protein
MTFVVPPNVIRGRLSQDELTAIEAMYEATPSTQLIAFALRRHPSTVNFALYRLGLRAPNTTRSFEYLRNGRTVKSFSPAEDALIVRLRTEGRTWGEIATEAAKLTGYQRSKHSIGARLLMLANIEDE